MVILSVPPAVLAALTRAWHAASASALTCSICRICLSVNPNILRAESVLAQKSLLQAACPPRYLCRFLPQRLGIYNSRAIICFTHRIVAPIGKDQLGKMVCSTSSCCGAGKSRRGLTRPLNFSCWEMTRTMGRKPTSTMGQRPWHKCSAESRSLPRSVVRDRRQTGSSSRCSGWPRLPHRPF